ncbi:NAD(P)H-binding protein [Aeromicrobium sp. P5_D10]
MSRIAIVGGHGKIARLLVPLLVADGHIPVCLIRNPDQAPRLEALGADVTLLDIEASEAQEFAAAFAGADAVVFAAGGGPDGNAARKKTVDLGGSLKSIAGATAAGVRRFVQISAISVDKPIDEGADPTWIAYVEAKRDADIALRDSDLDWTIIRPGGLTDGPPTGHITLAEQVERAHIPRADVAALVAAVIPNTATHRKQWEVISGPTPIADAITAAT